MIRVSFYELYSVEDSKLSFAVIMARYKENWVFVRHKERTTWETPGGHRENNEDINATASRELIEETGAKKFSIIPICIYSVDSEENESFGQLFYSDIEEFDELPNFEIDEVKFFEILPQSLTYPLIQPYLSNKTLEFLSNYKIC